MYITQIRALNSQFRKYPENKDSPTKRLVCAKSIKFYWAKDSTLARFVVRALDSICFFSFAQESSIALVRFQAIFLRLAIITRSSPDANTPHLQWIRLEWELGEYNDLLGCACIWGCPSCGLRVPVLITGDYKSEKWTISTIPVASTA